MGDSRSHVFEDAEGTRFEVRPYGHNCIGITAIVNDVEARLIRVEFYKYNALDMVTGILMAAGVDLPPALAQAFPSTTNEQGG